jgi:hypothetical protein
MDTRNGHVKFLQIVGLCEDEYGLIQQGYFDQVTSRVCDLAPLSITDIYRSSILEDRSTLDVIRSLEPNVSQTEVFGTVVEWIENAGQLEIRIGATVIAQMSSMFRGRLTAGDPVAVYGKGTGIVFEPSETNGFSVDDLLLVVSITKETAAYFADHLQPIRGEYVWAEFPALKINVVPIDIKDTDGKVVKTVG